MCVFSSYKQYMLWKIKINKHKKNIRTCNLTTQIALIIFFCSSFRTFLCLHTSSKFFNFNFFQVYIPLPMHVCICIRVHRCTHTLPLEFWNFTIYRMAKSTSKNPLTFIKFDGVQETGSVGRRALIRGSCWFLWCKYSPCGWRGRFQALRDLSDALWISRICNVWLQPTSPSSLFCFFFLKSRIKFRFFAFLFFLLLGSFHVFCSPR